MTPEQIEIGQLYTNRQHPKAVYMGITQINDVQPIPDTKGLVVINGYAPGDIVYRDENSKSSMDFWNDFFPMVGKCVKVTKVKTPK